jgi:subtilisin family serine protease
LFAAVPAGANGGQGVEQLHVVLYKGLAVPQDAALAIAAAGGELVRALPEVGIAIAVSGDPNFASRIRANRRVDSVGEDPVELLPEDEAGVSAPEPIGTDDPFLADPLWNIDRVRAPEAWAAGHTGSLDTVIAIIDSGVAWNHPDLAPNIVRADCFTSASFDNNPNTTCNPYPSLDFHGTQVAGVAVGVAPGIGIASYNVVEPVPGSARGGIRRSSRLAAMMDAVSRGYEVINLSLGGGLRTFGGRGSNNLAALVAADKRVVDHVIRAGTTVTASAGNEAVNLNGRIVHLPGDVPGVINVGATGIRPGPLFTAASFDVLAYYSNFGAPVDVVAPGGDCGLPDSCDPIRRPLNWREFQILTTDVFPLTPTCVAAANCDVGYFGVSGTSFAAPHVAAVAALVKDANPRLNPRQVASIVERTAEKLGDRQAFGHGMVDAAAATAAAAGR